MPSCVQYNYEGGATGYGCAATGTTLNVSTTAASPSATVVTTLEVSVETSTSAASATGTPSPSTNGSSHLSSGPIAGIVVGGIAAVVILLAVVIWLRRRRRRRSPNEPTQGPASREPKELPGSQNVGYRPIPPPSESDILSEYQPPSELEGLSLPSSPNPQKGSNSAPMATIPERNPVHELPGSAAVLPELETPAPENREPSQA